MSEPNASGDAIAPQTSPGVTAADELAELADEFARRWRAVSGRASTSTPAAIPPSRDILDTFPAIAAMEQPGLAGTADLFPAAERVGSTIGRYKLLERIGEGGFGVVFMAEQVHPVRRKVALKVIKPGFDTRQVIARFEAERQALALMDHENIARVFDAGATDSGRPYFVMELVRGVSITEYCDRGQVPPRERLALFLQVCRAVQHAHTKGVIHRDIKPTNVLVTAHDGVPVPKVIDFGIAKAAGQQLTDKTLFTNFAQMVGTPLYMSPEQAELSGLDVDTRSDVYSLGVLLYELLTGTTPFDKERLKRAAYDEVRRIIREEEPPRPSTRISTLGDELATVSAHCATDPRRLGQLVRGELDWIVMRAMEKDRRRRYETADALARDVERYLADEPVHARPTSFTYRLSKVARRHRAAIVAAGAFAVLLLAASVVSTWQAVRATRAERQVSRERDQVIAEKQQKEAALVEKQEALERAGRNERIAQQRLREGLIFAGESQLQSAQAALARESFTEAWGLSRALGMSETAPLAGILQTYAACPPPLLGDDGRRGGAGGFEGHRGTIRTIAFKSGSRMLVTAGYDGSICWWDAPTGAPLRTVTLDGPIRDLAVAPGGDDTLFAIRTDGRLIALDSAGRKLRQAKTHPVAKGLAISADGLRLLSTGSDGLVKLWDAATLREIGTFAGHNSTVHNAVFSPDGRRAFSGSEAGDVAVWELPGGRRIAMFPAHAISAITGMAFSPDGRILATCSMDNLIRLWDADSLELVRTIEGHVGGVLSIDFSPDGRWLVSGSMDRTVRLWEVAGGRQLGVFTGHQNWVRAVRFSGDGRSIVSGDEKGGIRVWTPSGAGEIPVLAGHSNRVVSIAVSRDHRVALSGSFDHSLRLWDIPTGRMLRMLPTSGTRVWGVALSPDGRLAIAGGEDRTVTLYDLASGRPLRRFEGHTDTVTSVAFCPDGQTAVSGSSDHTVKLWDLVGGGLLHTFTGHADKVRGVAVSPDGTRMLSASFDNRIKLWSITDRRHVRDFTGHSHWVMSVAFSPDGTRALSASWDQSVRLWDVDSGRSLRTFNGHSAVVLCVAFSEDASTAVSASLDNTIGVWDVDAGARLVSLQGHSNAVTSVGFAGEGLTFLSASRDGTIKVWDLDRPKRYQAFYDGLRVANERLRQTPDDPGALKAIGLWYSFRGADDAAAHVLERARAAGADVSPLTLARSYWKLGRLNDARREFEAAMRRGEAPRAYLELCLDAVDRDGREGAQPTTGRAATRPPVDDISATRPSPTSPPP